MQTTLYLCNVFLAQDTRGSSFLIRQHERGRPVQRFGRNTSRWHKSEVVRPCARLILLSRRWAKFLSTRSGFLPSQVSARRSSAYATAASSSLFRLHAFSSARVK